ncbi:hypothetical protein HQQ80_17870 [Microbacteriaceae bacterium VKM Ac-2855]|nr:hypothetical protein [Microbacteriaceae bacterium VKM Ac-2855]
MSGMLLVSAALSNSSLEFVSFFGDDVFLILPFVRYAAPLVLTFIAVALVIVPWPTRGPRGSAQLAPRTVTTFAQKGWLRTAAVTVMTLLAVTAFAGLISSPDEAGRYVMYEVKVSSNSSASTTTYGWWFAVPCLIAIAAIVALAALALFSISRPSLSIDEGKDVETRTLRTRNVLAITSGGLLIHLGAVLSSLYGTSRLRTGFEGGSVGWVELGTSFAAIGPVLLVASYASVILGTGMWWYTLVSTAAVRLPRTRESVPA